MRCCDREHHNWTDYDTHEERWNICLADMDRDKCPGFSRAKDVSDASISVCCPVRPEQQLASSTSVEEGTRSGAQEQEHLFQLNGKFMHYKRMKVKKKRRAGTSRW